MSDASLPLTVGEFEEWGDPARRDEYELLKTYCPYSNLAPGEYPAMLVKTSLHDSQVMVWEPAKYVARLRTLKRDGRPLLLKVDMAAGHGGASGRYDFLRDTAIDYAFLLGELGLRDAAPDFTRAESRLHRRGARRLREELGETGAKAGSGGRRGRGSNARFRRGRAFRRRHAARCGSRSAPQRA